MERRDPKMTKFKRRSVNIEEKELKAPFDKVFPTCERKEDESPLPWQLFQRDKRYDVYLYTEIFEPWLYAELLDKLKEAGKGDKIVFWINSPGGDYNTLASFIELIAETDSGVITRCSGEASSAAALLLCAGDKIRVTDWSSIFFHNIQTGLIDSMKDATKILKEMTNIKSVYRDLARSVCKDILTSDEIDSFCRDEKDLFMTGKTFMSKVKAIGRAL
jgi:ATP-dependent protease ClpP protease subunit